ncbi:hypothetical protein ZWY2020_046718 [Hordeum vulgare]|nr:hypothetical protein ZWY2020_046718 [Hordeum vulgare]
MERQTERLQNVTAFFVWVWTENPDYIPKAADLTIVERAGDGRNRHQLPDGVPAEEGRQGPMTGVLIHLVLAKDYSHVASDAPPRQSTRASTPTMCRSASWTGVLSHLGILPMLAPRASLDGGMMMPATAGRQRAAAGRKRPSGKLPLSKPNVATTHGSTMRRCRTPRALAKRRLATGHLAAPRTGIANGSPLQARHQLHVRQHLLPPTLRSLPALCVGLPRVALGMTLKTPAP